MNTASAVGAAASMSMADVDMTSLVRPGQAVDPEDSKPKWGLKDTVIFGGVVAAMVTAILPMAFSGSGIVYFAMSISLISSVAVGAQRSVLRNMDALRGAINKIREDVNKLSAQNDTFRKSNDELSTQVSSLKDMENQLNDVVAAQGSSISKFTDLIKENKEILLEEKKCIGVRLLQDLLDCIFDADRDSDYKIDPEEIDNLIMGLQNFDECVTFDEERFKEVMKEKGYGIEAVIDIVDDMVDPTKKNPVFKINDGFNASNFIV